MINLEENKVALTDSGFEEARKTIRRHRLSERLFHDVFEIQHDEL
ncbi:MAG TPA: DtxR family iron dependent repressor, partial [Proteobacteria bacterium]|nr:DtxR family iron dependent repressor [Pseudomonadota bacterium]